MNLPVSAVVLAGGKGTRLRSVLPDRPKILATVNGRPFITYVLDQLLDAGLASVILCVGHLAGTVQQELGINYRKLELRYLYDPVPLGTGGALRNAAFTSQHELILAMNGDSFVGTSLSDYIRSHVKKRWSASMLVTYVSDSSRFGTVQFTTRGRISRFVEKLGRSEPGWINGGVYLLPTRWVQELPSIGPFSLEEYALPQWVKRGLYAYPSEAPFIDIGLPRTLAEAPQFFSAFSGRLP